MLRGGHRGTGPEALSTGPARRRGCSAAHSRGHMDFQVAGAAFSLLFVMEMGDKTQLAVLSLSARTGRPWAVFLGAAVALAAVTLLGVTVGTVALTLLPGEWIARAAALAFIVIGLFILWAALRQQPVEDAEEQLDRMTGRRSGLSIAAGTSGLLFVAELGDKSQLAVIGLTAQTGNAMAVLAGAVTALTLVTLSGALLGKVITRVVPVRWLSVGAGVMFVFIGVLTLVGGT